MNVNPQSNAYQEPLLTPTAQGNNSVQPQSNPYLAGNLYQQPAYSSMPILAPQNPVANPFLDTSISQPSGFLGDVTRVTPQSINHPPSIANSSQVPQTATIPGQPMLSRPPLDELGQPLESSQIKLEENSENSKNLNRKITTLNNKADKDAKKIEILSKMIVQLNKKYPSIGIWQKIQAWFNKTKEIEIKALKIDFKDKEKVSEFCKSAEYDMLAAKHLPKESVASSISKANNTQQTTTEPILQTGEHVLAEQKKEKERKQQKNTLTEPVK